MLGFRVEGLGFGNYKDLGIKPRWTRAGLLFWS